MPTPVRRKRTASHIVAIVVGCLALFPGLAMVAGGSAVAIGQAVATDDDGYFQFTLDRLESDGVAIATIDTWLDDVDVDPSPELLDWLDVDLRLRVDGAVASDDVFVGIARSADVERYLSSASFSEIIEVDERTVTYREVAGSESIDPPTDQDFWVESASGAGEQELTWNARGGQWSVVVMNTDGSPVVAADVEIGARSGAVTPFAVFLLVTGTGIVLFAVVLIVIGARGRRTPERGSGHDSDSGSGNGLPSPTPTPAPPAPDYSAASSEGERLPTPVG